MKTNNRFDLETEIMRVWHTADDLDTILYMLIDAPEGQSQVNTMANMIIGLKEMHNARCQKLMEVFENVLEDGQFNEGTLGENKQVTGVTGGYAAKFKKWNDVYESKT
jgi:hypothetical protein